MLDIAYDKAPIANVLDHLRRDNHVECFLTEMVDERLRSADHVHSRTFNEINADVARRIEGLQYCARRAVDIESSYFEYTLTLDIIRRSKRLDKIQALGIAH